MIDLCYFVLFSFPIAHLLIVDEIFNPSSPSKIAEKLDWYSVEYYEEKELYMQNKKDYYMSANGIITFEIIKEVLGLEFDSFLLGNVIKYLARNGKKENAKDDLEKAKHYAEEILDFLNYTIEEFEERGVNEIGKIVLELVKGNTLQAQALFNEYREELEQEILERKQQEQEK